MRTFIIISLLLGIAFADCPKGTEAFNGGCAAMPSPADQTLAPMIGVMSDEKPPKSQTRAWEDGRVKANNPTSLAAQDVKEDEETKLADFVGKKAAGIK